jgi:hypothetical protein
MDLSRGLGDVYKRQAWSPAVATVVPDSSNRAAGISALVAQNCLPVASFTVTNLPILPSTNASQGTL